MEIESIKRKLPKGVIFYLNPNITTEVIQIADTDVNSRFVQFRVRVKKIFEWQRSKFLISPTQYSIPPTGPGSVDRKAYFLSLFGIVSLEATRVGTIQSLSSSFPKFVIPASYTRTLNQDIVKILNDFRESKRKVKTEALLRLWLWDPLLLKLFPLHSNMAIYSGFYSEWINERYIHQKIDGAVSMEFPDDNYYPMIFFEIDKNKVDADYDHKDLIKISVLLDVALKKLIGVCRRENKAFLSQLCVFGILVGYTTFDLCVAYPDFSSAHESDFNSDTPFPPYSIMFRYSRELWRFNLYGGGQEDKRQREHPDFNEFFFETETSESDPNNQHNFKIIPASKKRICRNRNDHENDPTNLNAFKFVGSFSYINVNIEHLLEVMDFEDSVIDQRKQESTINGGINQRSL